MRSMKSIVVELEAWELRSLKYMALRDTRTPENMARHLIVEAIRIREEIDARVESSEQTGDAEPTLARGAV